MILDEKKTRELENAARPLIEFLNTLDHPHVIVVVDCARAELFEGVANLVTYDYVKD